MTDAYAEIFALTQVALLSGIFYRMGGFTRALDDLTRRINTLEEDTNE